MDLVYIVYSQDLTDEILLPEQCFRRERFCEQIDCVLCFFFCFFTFCTGPVDESRRDSKVKLAFLFCSVNDNS